MNDNSGLPPNAVAIVGMAGRFPGATSPAELWKLVREGREAIRRLSDAELRAAGVPAALLARPNYVRAAATLDRMDEFDAGFFGFSPRDAAIMDPQHRHFLETAWEALESAGYTPEGFEGSIGVFGGCGMQAYFAQNLLNNPQLMSSAGYFLVRHTGNDKDFLATRVSYQLNLKGPSISVQTACSTSLVAVHLACQSLLNRECDMALAGGVTIELPHGHGYLYEEGEILSPDGHCRAFDAASKGTVFGSGAGIVVLRRLEDAIEAGDHIHAVVIGSAVNNDGAGKVGYLAPSVDGQAAVVAEAIALAGVSPETITYIETHGTGTPVGDPIEVAALTEAFGRQTTKRGYCGIGSIKTNIGHLDTAAGVASIIKAASAIEHGELPPSLNYEQPNPTIPFAETPFYVSATLRPWKPEGVRRAGVTSLGVGGTNAHVVLEEAPARPALSPGKSPNLLVISARSEAAVQAATTRLGDHLNANPSLDIADVAHTLQVGRRAFDYRRVIVAKDRADALDVMRGAHPKRLANGRRMAKTPSVVFLFPGGGAQYPNMGRDIYEHEPVFRQEIDRGLETLRNRHGIDLAPLLFPGAGHVDEAARELERSTLSILSIFIVEHALARLWMSWGVEPAAMTGHSLGEYAAACVAGVFSFEDALTIVKARGDIFERLPAGAMLSVPLSESELRPLLTGDLALAAVNGPSLCVASGPLEQIDALEAALGARDVEARRLHIAVAAHSAMLEPYLAEFGERVRSVRLSPPTIPFISNVTGQWADPAEVTRHDYWVRHLRQTVRFSDGLSTLLQDQSRVLIEAGPGVTLGSLARIHVDDEAKTRVVASMRHPQDASSDINVIYAAVGHVWIAGVSIDWTAFQGSPRRRVPLPTYPFEHQRYWIDATAVSVSSGAGSTETGRIADPDQWLSRPVWSPAPLPPPSASAGRTWLALASGATGSAAIEALLTRDHTVIRVEHGEAYEARSPLHYVVRADDADDYVRLLEAVAASGLSPSRVAHLWQLDAAPHGDIESRTLDARRLGFDSLLVFGRALANQSAITLERIDVVTAGMQQVADEPVERPEQALSLGPARVLPRELGVLTRSLDILGKTEPLVDELLADSEDATVALRGASRYVESLQPFDIPQPDESLGIRHGGVYAITGGTGGIGRVLAEYLARTYGAQLLLIARRRPDDQDRFEQLLRAMGATVMFAAADVTDATALRDALTQASGRLGRIDGIFHTAGTIDDGIVAEKTVAAAHRVLAPKVAGTLAIDRASAGMGVSFVVLFSSTSARLGLPGQIDYTAANAFLDAFARARTSADGPRFVSVAWGIWRDAGMAARLAGVDRPSLAAGGASGTPTSRLLGEPVRHDGRLRFVQTIVPRASWVVDEHRLKTGEAILPGTAYVEIARAAAAQAFGAGRFEIRDLEILSPLMFERDRPRTLRVEITDAGRIRGFAISSAAAGTDPAASTWSEHARGVVLKAAGRPARADVEALRTATGRREERFDRTRETRQERHISFGSRWRNLVSVRYGDAEALAELELSPDLVGDLRDYPVHPALLDLATAAGLPLLDDYEGTEGLFVPLGYGRIRIHGPLTRHLLSHIRLVRGSSPEQASFDVTVMDTRGRVLLEAHDFTMRRLAPAELAMRAARPSEGDSGAPISAAWLRNGIDAADGMKVLDRLLAAPAGAEVIVSSIPLDSLRAQIRPTQSARAAGNDGRALAPDDRPSGEVETELAQMWRDLLGVDTVGANDDFFELGGHSLIAVRLVNRVEKRFGARIKLATLFEARTVRHLAALLGGSREVSSYESLVAVQPSGTRPTLFVSHAVGGEVLSYSDLSRLLGPDQPFYAFRAVGHDGSRPFLTTIEEQAAFYVREMRMHQPEGPYYLAGYSHGGRVVFEMALQLRDAGAEVAFVGILDTWPHEGLPRGGAYALDWARNLPKWVAADWAVTSNSERWDAVKRGLRGLTRGIKMPRIAAAAVPAQRQIGDDMNLSGLPDHIRRTYENNFSAFLRYRPRFYEGPITLFRAEAQPLNSPHSRDLGWSRVARSVTVIDVPGNHGSLLQHPNVRDLARALREAMRPLGELPAERSGHQRGTEPVEIHVGNP